MLWSYCTSSRTSIREVTFSLAFRIEVVIPLELGIPSFQTIVFNEAKNERALHEEFDLIEERRNEVEIKNAINKKQMPIITPRKYKKKMRF